MRIQVWDYRKEYEELREEILGAVDKVFRSGRLILGQSVEGFERAFVEYCGGGFGVGVNSGTDALFLALKALGIGDGDEVITVSNTAVPTIAAIVSCGGVPRFVDIDPDTYLMDPRKIEGALTKKTRCILPVHLFGQCVDMDPLLRIAEANGLSVLEDCAQSTGAQYKGRRAGLMGHAAAFSFYPTKVLGAYGDGGMVVTRDEGLARRVRGLRMYGMQGRYYAEEHGYNSRLDEVQAEILTVKLRRIETWIACRRRLAEMYRSRLEGLDLALPVEAVGNIHVYYAYPVRSPRRDVILKNLEARGIYLNISYPWPVSLMRGYAHLGCKEGDLPVTESHAKQIFSLPMYPSLSDEEHEAVCRALEEVATNPSARRPAF
jgi:aminotransferase EvaB